MQNVDSCVVFIDAYINPYVKLHNTISWCQWISRVIVPAEGHISYKTRYSCKKPFPFPTSSSSFAVFVPCIIRNIIKTKKT